jgi:hypothetical protein
VSALAAPEDLRTLYGRYKALALSTSAGLLLGAPDHALAADAMRLAGDAEALDGPAPEAGREAALALHEVASAPASQFGRALRDARAAHRRLREEMWAVLGFEYAPCGAQHHAHGKGALHG